MSASSDAASMRGKATNPANANPSLTKAQLAAALADATISGHTSAMRAELNELVRRNRIVVTDR